MSPLLSWRVSACSGHNGDAQDQAGHGRFLLFRFLDGIVKSPETVTPAKAGVHNHLKLLDPRLRGDDDALEVSIEPHNDLIDGKK
ncbi:MAG: hypothetical protein HF981_13960 [Desulfobacteraceae bacterium]|nr:hypothetical protein [Desulfobacteraceae bacterium]MBC2751488.1 hypothetical protein [Desulfobacteraceae bacterium]